MITKGQSGNPECVGCHVVGFDYANGYDRRLSNTAHVLVRGQRARLAGRVMMNMIAVDVTDLPGAAAGAPQVRCVFDRSG